MIKWQIYTINKSEFIRTPLLYWNTGDQIKIFQRIFISFEADVWMNKGMSTNAVGCARGWRGTTKILLIDSWVYYSLM